MTDKTNLLVAAILGALLVLAIFIGMSSFSGNQASMDSASSPSIEITASGEAQAEPDMALLSVAVESESNDPMIARDRVASGMNNLRNALVNNGIKRDQITTTRYTVNERVVSTREDDSRETTYRATHAIQVEINETDRVGEIIDVALDNGANSIDNVEFTLSESTRSELKSMALTNAMNNARSQSETVAESADREIIDVRSVMSADSSFRPFNYRFETAGDSGQTDISIGPVTVDAQVTVVYNVD